MRSPRLARLASLLIAAAMVSPAPATAQPEPTQAELDQARQWFAQARKLEDAGKWAEALELLKKVGEVRTTPQVRFHIALCQENLGLWTQALDGFAQAARDAVGVAPDVIKESNQHVNALEKRIPTLTVRVNGAAPGDELLLDRRPIPMGDPPLPVRVDPGNHVLEVKRGDAVVGKVEFAIDPGSSRRIDTDVQPPPPAPPPTPAVHDPPPDLPNRGVAQRTIGWIALGVGGAAAIATGIFAGLRAGAISDLEDACEADLGACTGDPAEVDPIRERGETHSVLVNVFAITAGVAVAGGLVLLLTAPHDGPPASASGQRRMNTKPAVRAGAWATHQGAGVAVGGRF